MTAFSLPGHAHFDSGRAVNELIGVSEQWKHSNVQDKGEEPVISKHWVFLGPFPFSIGNP